MLKVLLALCLFYATALGVMALAQTALVFPRAAVGPPPALPAHSTKLQLDVGAGITLHGVRIAGRRADLPVLLGFGGNAWNAEAMALYLHQLAPDQDVVVFHYRGYAPSTGSPSAQALLADALALYDATAAPNGIVAIGFSIGSGIAAHLGAARSLRGLVLVTPFDNLRAVAQGTFPFFPIRWLFRHQIDTLASLRASPDAPVPTLIFATNDEVIAPARAAALLYGLEQAGRTGVQIVQVAAGHNDIYNHPDAQAALRRAIRSAR